MQVLRNLVIILLFLSNNIYAKNILEEKKLRLFELYKSSSISIRYFYNFDFIGIDEMQEIKVITKEILKKDPDYDFYWDVVMLYVFSCDGINYQSFYKIQSKLKLALNVKELFDLNEFTKPLQLLIIGNYFMHIEIWGNKSFGKIKTEDGLKYFKKIIKKYPKSKYVDDAYLSIGKYYEYRGIYYWKFHIPFKEVKEYKKKSINLFKFVQNEFPDSTGAFKSKQYLFNWYKKFDKKKAKKFINECINDYRKKGNQEAVARLLRRKASMYWRDKNKQEEVIKILEEINSLTKYQNLKKDVEEGLLSKYKKTKKYDKMIKILNKRLKEAEKKRNSKDIKYHKKRIKEIDKLKKEKNK